MEKKPPTRVAARAFDDLTHLADVVLNALHDANDLGEILRDLDVIVYLVDSKRKLTGIGARMNQSKKVGFEAIPDIVAHFMTTIRRVSAGNPELRAALHRMLDVP